MTPVAQTLLDLSAVAPFDRLRRAIAEAEFRRLLDIGEMRDIPGRGRPGSAVLRRALARHEPRLALTRSLLEERFLALCEDHEIPLPEVNVRMCGFLVDAVWRHERVGVELDGHAAHGIAVAAERDRARELALRTVGYVVVRYTWHPVTACQTPVAADLRRQLMNAATLPAP